MWFKQVSFYFLNPEKLPETEVLAEKLAEAAFKPVSGLERFSEGFAPPQAFSPEMVFAVDFTWGISLKKQEKVLPAAVVRDFVDDKVAQIEAEEGRKVGKKEKGELKEKITDDLLPRAFSRNSRIAAVCDKRSGLLLVNSGTVSRADNVLSKLREALGGLEAALPQTVQSPASLMTDWLLNGNGSGGFELDSECELKGQGDVAATVKVSKQDVSADEVVQHVKNGKTVSRLGLVWRDKIAFVLTAEFALTKIRYLDILQEEAESYGDDVPALAFATQVLMAQELSDMIAELVSLLGGRVQAA